MNLVQSYLSLLCTRIAIRVPGILAVLILSGNMLLAQKSAESSVDTGRIPDVFIGVLFGGEYTMHTGGFSVVEGYNNPDFSNDHGVGFGAGIGAGYRIDERFELGTAIVYRSLPGTFTIDSVYHSYLTEVGVINDTITHPTRISASAKVEYQAVSLDMYLKWGFFDFDAEHRNAFGAILGPSLHYILSTQFRQTQTIEEPPNSRFPNSFGAQSESNGQTLVYYDGEFPKAHTWRFGLRGGFFTDLFVSDKVVVTPMVVYDFGVTDVSGAVDGWKLHTLGVQLGMRYGF